MRWVAWIVMAVAYLGASTALSTIFWAHEPLVRYALAMVLIFFVTLVHELGHAIAVARVGGTLKSIMVFPLQFDLRTRRFGFARLNHRGDVGGYVSYSIDRIDARRKHVIVAAAGPAANMVGAGIGILLVQIEQLPTESAIATGFVLLSLGAAVANLIPFTGSDGAAVWRGLFGAPVR